MRTRLARAPGHDRPGNHDPAEGVAPEPPPRAVLEAHLDLGATLEGHSGRRRGGVAGTRMGARRRDEAQPHRVAPVGSEHRRHTAELRAERPEDFGRQVLFEADDERGVAAKRLGREGHDLPDLGPHDRQSAPPGR